MTEWHYVPWSCFRQPIDLQQTTCSCSLPVFASFPNKCLSQTVFHLIVIYNNSNFLALNPYQAMLDRFANPTQKIALLYITGLRNGLPWDHVNWMWCSMFVSVWYMWPKPSTSICAHGDPQDPHFPNIKPFLSCSYHPYLNLNALIWTYKWLRNTGLLTLTVPTG